jgi:hypothetical protein
MDNDADESRNTSRGKYRPSFIGLMVEYQADSPLDPWAYSYLIPDTVLSYTTIPTNTHSDLVILRFGRPEVKLHEMTKALNGMSGIKVQKIQSFQNKKNSNRLHYLKNVIFPRMSAIHHQTLRAWQIKDAMKSFDGVNHFLKCLEENDITGSKWSRTHHTKAIAILSKYN